MKKDLRQKADVKQQDKCFQDRNIDHRYSAISARFYYLSSFTSVSGGKSRSQIDTLQQVQKSSSDIGHHVH
jgi:hypothetical protein